MQQERIRFLNKLLPRKGKYVAYWMQSSQRTIYNHALEYSIQQANSQKLPLICFFGLTEYPSANLRAYQFMLEGLEVVKQQLKARGISFIIKLQSPDVLALEMSQDASLMVVDRGYMRIQRKWREHVARHIECQFIQLETDVLVPVETASDKEEFAARTIRPKITSKIEYFAKELQPELIQNKTLLFDEDVDFTSLLKQLKIDYSVPPTKFKGGELEACKMLDDFIENKLHDYADKRNHPSLNATSNLSPYLHFGMISPLMIYLKVKKCKKSENTEAFIEELIVRRELSMNFVFYNPFYDCYECLPKWAKETLQEHSKDKRDYIYTLDQFEKSKTHDPYWNAAQTELVKKGKMAGYMRMYWGKKVIEWTPTPQDAYKILVHLNDKYELDGRDPNGYAGVAWCFGKHDRPWAKRSIFGTIRYMVDTGLARKFNAKLYVEQNPTK